MFADLPIDKLKTLDPITGLRQAFIARCGDLPKALSMLDKNGDGVIQQKELFQGFKSLNIPWRDITGLLTEEDIMHLFDADGSGDIDLNEFLGFPDEVGDWRELDHEAQWRYYYTRVLNRRAYVQEAKWNDVEYEHERKEREPENVSFFNFFRSFFIQI